MFYSLIRFSIYKPYIIIAFISLLTIFCGWKLFQTSLDIFPEFSAAACDIDNMLIDIDVLQEDMWTVVYFYPKDFTFICPTEINT